jgi:hypothetical protein
VLQTDVGIPIVAEAETAKVHVAMWLERVPEQEVRGIGPPHTLKKVNLGPDVGFNVRAASVQDAPADTSGGGDRSGADAPSSPSLQGNNFHEPLSPMSADLLALERRGGGPLEQ